MNERILFLVGGTGGGPTAKTFKVELWTDILSSVRSSEARPKIALLITPSTLAGNKIDTSLLESNYRELQDQLDCDFTIVDEERLGSGDYNQQFDALCITCGNTNGAREIWQSFGCEDVIRDWYSSGLPIIGYSAGFILFYEWASTDSIPGPVGTEFGVMPCMGILKGAAIPHADTQPCRVPDFQKVLTQQPISPAFALGEDAMAVYNNEELRRIVSPLEKPFAAWLSADSVSFINVQKIYS